MVAHCNPWTTAHKALNDLSLTSILLRPPPHSLCSSWTSPYLLTVTANSCFRAFVPLLGNTPDLFLLLNLQVLTEVSLPLRGLPREQNSLLPSTLHHVILSSPSHSRHHLTYVYVSLGTSFLECEH